MRLFDPTPLVIPSFQHRAAARLADLARLLAALSYTEGADSPALRPLLLDAARLRHALRSLSQPGTLTADEQRFLVERLLPTVADVPEVVPPAPALRVPVGLSVAGSWNPAAPTPARLTATTGATTPAGAVLTLYNGSTRIRDYADAQGGAYRVVETHNVPQLRDYSAELTYQGRLLGKARAALPVVAVVRFGTFAAAGLPTDAQLLALASAPAATGLLTFSVPSGRQRLYLLLPAGTTYQLIDPTLQVDITNQFDAEADALGLLLRQKMPVIGPFSVSIQLVLTS